MEDLNQGLLLLIFRIGIVAFALYCLGIGLVMLVRQKPFMMRTAVAMGLFGAAIVVPLLVISGYLVFNQAWVLAGSTALLALIIIYLLARNARGYVVHNVTMPLLQDALSAALADQNLRYIIEAPEATFDESGRRRRQQLAFFRLLDHDALIQLYVNAPFLLAAVTVDDRGAIPYADALFAALGQELGQRATPFTSGAAFFMLAGVLLLVLALGPAVAG